MGRKHFGKRRNCSLRAISPFPTVFSRLVMQTRKNQGLHTSPDLQEYKIYGEEKVFFQLQLSTYIYIIGEVTGHKNNRGARGGGGGGGEREERKKRSSIHLFNLNSVNPFPNNNISD